MRIFAGGILTETNTFSSRQTLLSDFCVQGGISASEANLVPEKLGLLRVWQEKAALEDHVFIAGLVAEAEPSGITARAAYESLRDQLLSDLHAAMPVDVALLMLHGAMVAEGYLDCEEDIIGRVREIVGQCAKIGVEFDLHCQLTETKIARADIVVTYKEYPHVDVGQRAREVFEMTTAAFMGKIRPVRALFDCRMIGYYPTSRQPLRDLVQEMKNAEGNGGVLSVSLGHGFPLGDVVSPTAKVLVIADGDHAVAMRVAQEFGEKFYALRRQVGFDSISEPMDIALSRALMSKQMPIVVADQSDNTGGGAPGDSTFALRWLLDHVAKDVAIAFLYDPDAVLLAKQSGVGSRISAKLGGKLGTFSGEPVQMECEVLAVRENYLHEFPQASGPALRFRAGDIARLRSDTIDIVVSSERCQCYSPSVFLDLGIDPSQKRILIPKSMQHFLDAFAPIASEVIYMCGPGAVTIDPRQLVYQNLDVKCVYPWVADACVA
jgi:microcystin degradation protein MlrC